VRVVLSAHKTDFPSDEEAHLFDRVRKLAEGAVSDGFAEVGTAVTRVPDPGDSERTLDTHYEITYAKRAVATRRRGDRAQVRAGAGEAGVSRRETPLVD
jgi:hypothetical protein